MKFKITQVVKLNNSQFYLSKCLIRLRLLTHNVNIRFWRLLTNGLKNEEEGRHVFNYSISFEQQLLNKSQPNCFLCFSDFIDKLNANLNKKRKKMTTKQKWNEMICGLKLVCNKIANLNNSIGLFSICYKCVVRCIVCFVFYTY